MFKTLSLTKAPHSMILKIKSIPDPDVKIQLIRFGITEGTKVKCYHKIPMGPLVIRYYKQEIAIGRKIANSIMVEPL
jgi:Fe2+ transport system protein FeoA